MTVRRKLYASDKNDRYFHIYHSRLKESAECEMVEAKVERIATYLKKQEGKVITISDAYEKYFEPFIYEEDGFLCLLVRSRR